MDNLTRKCMAAKAEGLSYGQWVAKHPEGLPEEKRPTKEQKQEQNLPPNARTKVCSWCGQNFAVIEKYHRKYCSVECRCAADQHQRHAYGKKRREMPVPEVKACGWCGQSFTVTNKHRIYCGPDCSRAAARHKEREHKRMCRQEKKEAKKA